MDKNDLETLNDTAQKLAKLMAGFTNPAFVHDLDNIKLSSQKNHNANNSKVGMLQIIQTIPQNSNLSKKKGWLSECLNNAIPEGHEKEEDEVEEEEVEEEKEEELAVKSSTNESPLVNFRLAKVSIKISNSKLENEVRSENSLTKDHKVEKRKRVCLTTNTKAFLEHAFKMQPFPNRKDRELISRRCGLTNVQVRIWFTNKRMRVKLQKMHNSKFRGIKPVNFTYSTTN